MSTRYTLTAVVMILLVLLASSGNVESTATAVPPTEAPLSPTAIQASPLATPVPALPVARGDVARTVLTFDELMNGSDPSSPVNDGAFALPGEAAPSEHAFEGRLELFGEDTNGDVEMLRGELEPESAHLPKFDYEFVQSGSYLVPTQRGLITADHANWNYMHL